MPSVSVIVPFYKDYAYVKQAVQSVLAENLPDCEVIIVNDNPSDRTDEFLRGCRFSDTVRIVTHETNRGLSAARNTGVDEAVGEIIAYLDADDFYLPQGLRRQVEWHAESGADICHGVTVLREQRGITRPSHSILARDKRWFQINRTDATIADLPALQLIVSSWQSTYKREYLERSGIRFDEAQKKFEDRLYVLETVFSGATFALTSVPTRVWRRRRDSITTSAKSIEDVEMMTALIDKCTALAERAHKDGRIDGIHVRREVAHSLSRLLYELPVLDVAVGNDDVALPLREKLSRSMGRAAPDSELFDDYIVKSLIVDGRRDKRGHPISLEHVASMWKALAADDWESTRRLHLGLAEAAALKPAQKISSQENPVLAAPAVVEGPPAFPDCELILHLGMHKTGTTHLQRQLVRHDDALKKGGTLFPKTGFVDHRDVALKPNATPGHQEFIRAMAARDTAFREEFEREVAGSGCARIVISCENLSFPYADADRRIERVDGAEAFFRNFPKRRIVATIRRPDQYIESMYRERVTNTDTNETRSILEYLNEHRTGLLDYAAMLDPWRNFANGNISLIDYADLRDSPDYLSLFSQSLGMELPGYSARKAGAKPTYESPHWDEIEIIRIVTSTVQDLRKRRSVALGVLNSTHADRARKVDQSVLSVDDRLEILAENRAYCEEFFRSSGFSYDFETVAASLEAERGKWTQPTGIDYQLVQALLNSLHTSEAVIGTAPAKRRFTGKTGSSGGLTRMRSTLMPVYRHMPGPIKSLARSGYRWLAGQPKAVGARSNQQAGA
ncbi:glycosyltransferase family 2 protein [Microbaculum marinum]|uniref:Glycosyltransferase family 2 protein n=1 Tax=Microbaculum marinum TaxID=1764581 RepID=A0AAW9RPZ8_9HYPH